MYQVKMFTANNPEKLNELLVEWQTDKVPESYVVVENSQIMQGVENSALGQKMIFMLIPLFTEAPVMEKLQ